MITTHADRRITGTGMSNLRLGVSVAALALAFVSSGHGASTNFAPDVVFTGSSLTAWRTIGQCRPDKCPAI